MRESSIKFVLMMFQNNLVIFRMDWWYFKMPSHSHRKMTDKAVIKKHNLTQSGLFHSIKSLKITETPQKFSAIHLVSTIRPD